MTNGNVKINGFDIEKNFEKAIEKVGTIVENPDLYMYLTGLENLKIIKNMYKDIDEKRIEEVVKLVKLEERINDKVSKYSLGMRQRLGIAQAILHKPNILILDEPTNGLDPEGIKELRDLLKKMAKEENMGVLISSHNLAELESFCNKITIIQNGQLIDNSNLEEVKTIRKSYIIELDNLEKLETILNFSFEKLNDYEIKVNIDKEDVPQMVEDLVSNGKKIYKVVEETVSLEDAFLKKTGGNIIG